MPVVAPKPVQDKFVALRVESLQSKSTEVVLGAAGDLLRRTARAGAQVIEQAEKALDALAIADVEAAVQSIDTKGCRSALENAGKQAFEAAFADSPEERQVFATSALDSIMVRDRAASILFAARHLGKGRAAADLGGALAKFADAKASELATIDAILQQSTGRSLTGVNAERRASLADLDASERAGATWFAAFVDADDMLQGLAGTKTADLTESTRASLEASSLPAFTKRDGASVHQSKQNRGADAESSALSRLAMGTISPSERAFLDARAQRDPSLARDLREVEAPHERGEADAS